MKPADRDRLVQRRALLAARLKRRQLGEHSWPMQQEMRRRGLTAARVGPAAAQAALARLTDGPGLDERLDWSFVTDARRRQWGVETNASDLIAEAFDDLGVRGAERVLLVWHPGLAALRVRSADLVKLADIALRAHPEVWVCSADGDDWLVESSRFDREICWGRPLCGDD